jgi:hypothetical protein
MNYRIIKAPDGDGFTIQEKAHQLDGDYHWLDIDWAPTLEAAEEMISKI